MPRKFAAVLAAVLLAFTVTAASADAAMYVYSRNGLSVSLHEAASESSHAIMKLGVGFAVTVKDLQGTWCEVKVRVGGQIFWGFIRITSIAILNPALATQTFRDVEHFTATIRPVTVNGLTSLRSECRKTSDEISTLAKDEAVTVIAVSNAWYKVTDSKGNTGYIPKACTAQ